MDTEVIYTFVSQAYGHRYNSLCASLAYKVECLLVGLEEQL